MKDLILVCTLIIFLCVSCASSRQEFSSQQSSAVTSVQMQSGIDYMEELLSQLAAKFSDSVHVVVENYYPPKSDSDSVGPLKTKVTYQRKAKADVHQTERSQVHAKDSTDIQRNDSTSSARTDEVQKESSAFRFNLLHLFAGCVVFMFVYYIGKNIVKCSK